MWKVSVTARIDRPQRYIKVRDAFLNAVGLGGSLYRNASSSTRWQARQNRDRFTREAKVQDLKSRAAFKLLQINQKHRIFSQGDTVVDLGYAPGSWSQVAIDRTGPSGRVVGVDIIPAQPPAGVSTIQGNFLSPEVQEEVRAYVHDSMRGRPWSSRLARTSAAKEIEGDGEHAALETGQGYVDSERSDGALETKTVSIGKTDNDGTVGKRKNLKDRDDAAGRVVDVVLSDMMMNTSGVSFKDHAGSMDLCMAALTFCYDTLRTGGHFVCKFYQGSEDKGLETRLKRLFEKVHREKPESSRKESKEAYFVALRRKEAPLRDEIVN